jgi:ankyrin repeat protein
MLLKHKPEAVHVKQVADGSTPLHLAVANPDVELAVLETLLKYDPDALVQKTKEREIPLHVAVHRQRGDEHGASVVELLLKSRPETALCAKDYGLTPLHAAVISLEARHGAAVIEALLKFQPAAALKQDQSGYTPLHRAVLHDNLEAAQILLSSVPEAARVQDAEGATVLHLAATRYGGGTFLAICV